MKENEKTIAEAEELDNEALEQVAGGRYIIIDDIRPDTGAVVKFDRPR